MVKTAVGVVSVLVLSMILSAAAAGGAAPPDVDAITGAAPALHTHAGSAGADHAGRQPAGTETGTGAPGLSPLLAGAGTGAVLVLVWIRARTRRTTRRKR